MDNETKQLCITCLSRDDVSILLDIPDNYSISPSDIIKQCTKIQLISSDESPNKICRKCSQTLKDIHAFFTKATNSQSVFQCINIKNEKTDKQTKNKDNILRKPPKESKILPKPSKIVQNQVVLLKNVIDVANVQPLFIIPNSNIKNACFNTNNPLQIIQCPKCTQQFTSKELLQSHFNQSHSNVMCSLCKVSFNTDEDLQSHNLSVHFPAKSVKMNCNKCNKKFESIWTLTKHMRNVHKKTTDIGTEKILEKNKIKTDKECVCKLCNRSFATSKNLTLHMKYHTGYVCPYCGKAYCSENYLQKHIEEHSQNSKPYFCLFCEKMLTAKKVLLRHYRKIHGVDSNIIICAHCNDLNTGFTKLTDVEEHMSNCHQELLSDVTNTPVENENISTEKQINKENGKATRVNINFNKSTGKIIYSNDDDYAVNSKGETINTEKLPKTINSPEKLNDISEMLLVNELVCQICEDVFPTNQFLLEHLANYHFIDYKEGIENGIDDEMLKNILGTNEIQVKHSCEFCKKSYFYQQNLEKHIQKAHPTSSQFNCTFCSIEILDKYELKEHIKLCRVDKLGDKYTCQICSKRLTSAAGLKYHIEYHNGELNIPCSQCDRRFLTHGNLKKHWMTVHSKIKPYACTKCERTFASANHLQKHTLTHLAKRDFLCTVCGKAFYQSSHVRHHMWTHTKIKPYMCPYCPNVYTARNSLAKHVKNNHSDKQQDISKFKFKLNPMEISNAKMDDDATQSDGDVDKLMEVYHPEPHNKKELEYEQSNIIYYDEIGEDLGEGISVVIVGENDLEVGQ